MEMFGRELIIGGFFLMMCAQVVASIIAFRVGVAQGLGSLIIPGYLLVTMRRAGYYGRFFAGWGIGVLGIVAGTVALS